MIRFGKIDLIRNIGNPDISSSENYGFSSLGITVNYGIRYFIANSYQSAAFHFKKRHLNIKGLEKAHLSEQKIIDRISLN